MKTARFIILAAMAVALCVGCRTKVEQAWPPGFWEKVHSGEIRNFMLRGFKVGVRSDHSWPVIANVYVPTERLDEAKQSNLQLQRIIASRLAGLEKEDIVQPERRTRIERDILVETTRQQPGISVQKIFVSLEMK